MKFEIEYRIPFVSKKLSHIPVVVECNLVCASAHPRYGARAMLFSACQFISPYVIYEKQCVVVENYAVFNLVAVLSF